MLKFQSTSYPGIKTQEDVESRDSAAMLHQKNRAKTGAMPEQAEAVRSPPQASEIQFEDRDWIAKSPGNYVWLDNRDRNP